MFVSDRRLLISRAARSVEPELLEWTMDRRNFLTAAGSAIAFPVTTFAQSYPTRSVRVIVPFAPGGPTDVFARLLAQKLSANLGHQFYIENLSGGGANIGMSAGARAAPDGHTILF